jgi:hypothetical protein
MVKDKNNLGSNENNENKQNIFSRFYNYLEDKYSSLSNWLTEKGIPLNNLNNYLEEKGLPAFAIVASILLLLIFIIVFLIIFSFSSQSTLIFSVKDYSGLSINDAFLKITNSSGKEIFSGTVNDNDVKKIKLKLGESYSFKSTKDGYPEFSKSIIISDKDQKVQITFSELVEYGVLKIRLIDRDNKGIITSGTAIARYTINNAPESTENIVNIANDHFITLEVPMNKDIELLVSADDYEDFKETNFRITLENQEKVIEMDISSLSFEGKSQVTFVVLDTEENPIDDALVSIYNLGDELLDSKNTIDGRALSFIDSGSTISYKVEKEGYRTFISDPEVSFRITKSEITYNVTLEEGGNFLDVFVKSGSNFLSLGDVAITVYDLNNNIINSGNTDDLGNLKLTGLSDKAPIVVTACKEDFLCENLTVDLLEKSSVEFTLERIDVTNSAILSVFVVDEKNLPISKAFIKIYQLLQDEKEVPYNTSLQTDLTGSLSVPLRVGDSFRVYSLVGEVQYFEDVTIDALRENKIIFVMDNASKIIKLDLYDENGFKLTSGSLLVKTKDGTVLFDGNLSETDQVSFISEGYKDLYAEYTDVNGNKSSINFNADESESDGYIRLDFNKEVNLTDYPVIEFSGIVDSKGVKSNFVTIGKEYYLIFDVLFPENTYKGQVHIRAGDDTQVDVEEMSYGITGFSAMDIYDFKYGTTYNSSPLPGLMNIDLLNEGSSQVLNKWLELKWDSDVPLGNKQIKVKINVTDDSYSKLTFKYRTLFEENKLYYRDPVDSLLNQSYSSPQKGALYADTKEVNIDVYNVPLDCEGSQCVSYTFIDSKGNEFSKDDFYAVRDETYFLKVSLYSLDNKQLDLLAETSKSFPLISFGSFSDNLYQNEIINDNSLFEISRDGFLLSENSLKNIYLSFISKDIGAAYIDLKATDVILGNEILNNRLSFNVYDKKEMNVLVSPSNYVEYGSNFTVDVLDSVSLEPITDAFISFYDVRDTFISSLKPSNSNGRNGKYTITNNFNTSIVKMVVERYGYLPYDTEIYIIDNTLLNAIPSEIIFNLGLDQTASTSNFSLENLGNYQATNVRFGEPIWIEGSAGIYLEGRGNPIINKNSTQNYQLLLTTDNDLELTTAYAHLPVYANIGPREVTKILNVRINKGLMLNECVEITPSEVSSFVGLNVSSNYADPFNTPFTDYDYTSNTSNNPMLAPSQSYSNYEEYLNSSGYNITDSTDNSYTYTDSSNYTYHATSPALNSQITENTTYFTIKNNCSQAITFNPQAVLTSSSSNNNLEVSLANVTILPGEEKVYDVILKNSSELKRKTTYTYNILWHNNYYSIAPSVLNVDLLDLSRALWITPKQINVPISQVHPQQAAENYTRFFIKNIGAVPITDIQISQYPKMVSSNIKITEYPRQVSVLEPGKTIPVDLKFSVNINKSTLDDALIQVTGKAVGISEPIISTTQLVFSISSPNCLKVSNKNINYNLEVGETRARNITITNQCSEPVTIVGIDKKQQGYYQAYGDNSFRITPASGNPIIPVNMSNTYRIEFTANSLGGSPKTPMILQGRLMNSGNPVTSEEVLVSITIDDIMVGEEAERNISILSSLPSCEDPQNINSYNRPLISIKDCSETSGYCDGESSAELILKKVNELQNEIKQFSAQTQSKVIDTGCTLQDAYSGFCKISELGGGIDPVEFSFFMQNDNVTPDLIKEILKKSNYSFKNYFVETNIFNKEIKSVDQYSSYGVYAGGNKIFVSPHLSGCGKYTVEIDGYVAASPDYIYPERAYYYINVVEKDTNTIHCEKNIVNYLNYLPWDLSFNKNQRAGTWLTLFTGDENLSKALIKSVGKFKSDEIDLRYVYNKDVLSTRNSTLNVSTGEISENKEALAKISFNDTSLRKSSSPEQIDITLNSLYNSPEGKTSEYAIKDFSKVISSMISDNDYSAKVCISEDKTYMLVLDVISAGDLTFVDKEISLPLKDGPSCSLLKVKSAVPETLKITSDSLDLADVSFKKTKNDTLQETLDVSVIANKDSNFYMCVTPNSDIAISALVDKKVTVTATSIYSASGSVGNRSTTAEVAFSSCAITPEDYLLGIYSNILTENNKAEDDRVLPQNYTAIVDWDKQYNPEEKEKLCSTLQKIVNSKKYNGELFFDYEVLGCELEDSSQERDSRISKGLHNAGQYFFSCSGACGLCYGLSGLIMPTQFVGAIVDCLGFSCLLPSLNIFASNLSNGEGGIEFLLDEFFGLLLNDDVSFFSNITSEIRTWVTGALGVGGAATSGALKANAASAAVPLDQVTQDLVSQSSYDPTTQQILDDLANPSTTPTPVSPSTTSGVINGSTELKNLNSQLNNLNRYLSGNDNIKLQKFSNPQEVGRFSDILRKMSQTSGSNFDKLRSLSTQEFDDFVNILEKYNFTGKNSHLFKKDLLIKRLKDAKVNDFKSVSAATSSSAATASSSAASVADDFYDYPKADYDQAIKNFDNDIKMLDDSISNLENQKAAIETNAKRSSANPKKAVLSKSKVDAQIKAIDSQLDELKKSKDALSSVKSKFASAKNVNGTYKVPTSAIDDLSNNIPKQAKLSKLSKFAKIKGVAKSFGRGLVCGATGNAAGIYSLKKEGKTGLNKSIEFLSKNDFEKNIFYVSEVDMLSPENDQEYETRYTINIKPYISQDQSIISSIPTKRIDSCTIEE